MLEQKTEVVLLDNDGTVVDTKQHIINDIVTTVKAHDPRRQLTQEEIDNFFGPPLETCYQKLYPEADQEFVFTLSQYHRLVSRDSLHLVQLYPGMIETLDRLRGRGLRLGLVTSRERESLLVILDNLKIERFFDAIVAQDDVIKHKPDPAPVKKALELLDVGAGKAFMVGDTVGDILAGKAAGTKTIAALYGFANGSRRESLFQAGADHYIEAIEDILKIV